MRDATMALIYQTVDGEEERKVEMCEQREVNTTTTSSSC